MYRINKFSVFIALIVISLMYLSCKKDFVKSDYIGPYVVTNDILAITDTGITITGKIISIGTENELTDHGFIWSTSPGNLKMGYQTNYVSLGSSGEVKDFTANIDQDIFKGTTYYICSYATTKKLTTYGNVLQFVSNGSKTAKVRYFTPEKAIWNDTLLIYCENLSNVASSNKLFINGLQVSVSSSKNNVLKYKIAEPLADGDSATLSVELSGTKYTIAKKLAIKYPEILSVSSLFVQPKEEIEIKLNYESYNYLNNKIRIDSTLLQYNLTTNKYIIPFNIARGYHKLSVEIGGRKTVFQDSIYVDNATITKIVPSEFFIGDTVVVEGFNFSTNLINSKLLINNKQAIILGITGNGIKVVIPEVTTEDISFVYTYNSTLSATFNTKLAPIQITSVSPLTAFYGTEITIKGKNYHPVKEKNVVKLGNDQFDISYLDKSTIKIKINKAFNLTELVKELTVNNDVITAKANDKITFFKPEYTSISTTESEPFNKVVITGKNIYPFTSLLLNSVIVPLRTIYPDSIVFNIPPVNSFGNYAVSLSAGDYSIAPFSINLINRWSFVCDWFSGYYNKAPELVYNNKAYYFSLVNKNTNVSTSKSVELDLSSNTWTFKKDNPYSFKTMYKGSFIKNDMGYFAVNYKDTCRLMAYDFIKDSLSIQNKLPNNTTASLVTFQNELYLFQSSKVYLWDQTGNTWIFKHNYTPVTAIFTAYNDFIMDGAKRMYNVFTNTYIDLVLPQAVYYNESWNYLNNVMLKGRFELECFYFYDITNSKWYNYRLNFLPNQPYFTFIVDNNIYIVAGNINKVYKTDISNLLK